MTKIKRGTVQASMIGDDDFYSFERWNGQRWERLTDWPFKFTSKREADETGRREFRNVYRK